MKRSDRNKLKSELVKTGISINEADYRIASLEQIFRSCTELSLDDMYDLCCDWLGEQFEDYFNYFL